MGGHGDDAHVAVVVAARLVVRADGHQARILAAGTCLGELKAGRMRGGIKWRGQHKWQAACTCSACAQHARPTMRREPPAQQPAHQSWAAG